MARNVTGATRPIREAREKDASTGARHMAAVEAILAAIERGDYDDAVTDVRDDVTLDIFAPPEFPWLRRARGRQELRKVMQHNFGTVTDQRPEINTVLAQDDVVVLIGREQGTDQGYRSGVRRRVRAPLHISRRAPGGHRHS